MPAQKLLVYGRPPEQIGRGEWTSAEGLISRTACLARTELAELAFTHSRPACADEDGNAYSWQRDPTRQQTDRLRPARSIRWASSASSTPSRTSAKPTDPL
jgi:hypothetical protein